MTGGNSKCDLLLAVAARSLKRSAPAIRVSSVWDVTQAGSNNGLCVGCTA